jgi:23S rRNA-/tRNA-specific pseudouridylate synthase
MEKSKPPKKSNFLLPAPNPQRQVLISTCCFLQNLSKTMLEDNSINISVLTIADDNSSQCLIYHIGDSQRHVIPYWTSTRTHAKGRWFGRSLIEVLTAEFRVASSLEHRFAIERGHITVNCNRVMPEYIICGHDVLETRRHRHEPPVSAKPIKYYQDAEKKIIAVDKPPSIPVHVCGPFDRNSLQSIMQHSLKCKLFPIHRLDRLTSGLCLFASNPQVAAEFQVLMKAKKIRKTYLARVRGEFCPGRLAAKPNTVVSMMNDTYTVTVNAPIWCQDVRRGVHVVDARGKPSVSEFALVGFNGRSSLVLCRPGKL